MAELVPAVPRIFNHKVGTRPVSVISVVDAARLLGYPYRKIQMLIKRNWALFDGLAITVTVILTRHCQRKNGTTYIITRRVPLLHLTEHGWVALVIKLSVDRIKDPARIEHIRRIQKHTLAHMRAVQEGRCPPSDQALNFDEVACLPRNRVRGALLLQHAEAYGVHINTVRARANEVRVAAGLPAWKWHREARARMLAYLETHPGAPLKKLMEVAGEPISMPTACRVRNLWRRTRAALASHELFTTPPHSPQPAA